MSVSHSKKGSMASISVDLASATNVGHARMLSMTDEEQDSNSKYISVKEFETLVATKPFDEVLENVMKAYDLGDDINTWPE